jgi:hypothetical protein
MDININIPDIQVDYLAETWGKDMEDTSQTNEQFVTEYVHVLHTQEVISKGRQELMQSILNGNQVAAVKIND